MESYIYISETHLNSLNIWRYMFLLILACCQISFIRMSYLRAAKSNNNLECNLPESKLVKSVKTSK